jgi:hypothetical protein
VRAGSLAVQLLDRKLVVPPVSVEPAALAAAVAAATTGATIDHLCLHKDLSNTWHIKVVHGANVHVFFF